MHENTLSLFNEIFSVTSEVVSAIASLINEFGGHIENAEMKSDMDHFGKFAGLNDNHVKPDKKHRRETLFY